MARRFATGDSDGPNVANLQINFWKMAVEVFYQIIEKWKIYAVDEEGEEVAANDEYTENEFVIDAAVAIVIAGISISELIGQNVPSDGNKTPHLRPAYKALFRDHIPDDVGAFFSIYDSLRHFGPAKYNAVSEITEKSLCEHFKTAQSIWNDVLKLRNAEISDEFRHDFLFP